MDDEGLELTPKTTRKTGGRKKGEAKGEAFLRNLVLSDPQFAAVAAAWPTLSPAIKAGIMALVNASR